ncbi:MAG: hypothetical protein ABEJ74_06405 [Haloferacaceae archaeon]
MAPSVFAPPKAIVALLTAIVVVFASSLNTLVFVEVPPMRQLPRRAIAQLVSDFRRRERRLTWLGLLGWGGAVSALHFGGLAYDVYTRIWWWDLLTHVMAGVGVAGILLVGLRETVPAWTSNWWVVVAVVGIGAGFEVYEFAFKSFWHTWTLSFYLQDTLIDLAMDAVGGYVAAVLSSMLLGRTDQTATA